MEKRDLYNENRELLGKTIFKDEVIPDGSFILMVVGFIENSDGQYLIQKRSGIKGGEWAFTGGHPKHGESSLEGIKTEIIEELEPVRRGIYTGSIGWIGYSGDTELNIVIRTLLAKDGIAHVQAGAGIVIDSNPENEYKESLKKAIALWRAKERSEETVR